MARFDDEEKQGAPEWITTFADMMSLLLTFFVFILTFSTIEMETYKKVEGALQAGLNITERQKSERLTKTAMIPREKKDVIYESEGPEQPNEKIIEESEKQLELSLREVSPQDVPFDLDSFPEGVRIMPDEGVFMPSSAELTDRWAKMVRNVADVVMPQGKRVAVRGRTDDRFLATTEFPTVVDLEIGRAVRVATELARGGLSVDRIEIRAGGTRDYPFPNDSAQNRARNRTFEILVYGGGKD